MATRDVRSCFIRKKAEKKESQVQVPQLVKTPYNVTVAEVSAINTELKNLCKEKKKYQIDLPSKVKYKVGKDAHRYGTQPSVTHFHGKYQKYTLKRTTVNNWKRTFSNAQKGVRELPEKFNKKGRPLLVGEGLLVKIKEAIIRIRLTGEVIFQKMIISISNDVLKANNSNSLSEFRI